MNPQWRLKVVDVHIEHGESIVIFVAEVVIRFAEAVLVHNRRAICTQQQRLLRTVYFLDSDIHLGQNGARDGEFGVHVGFRRRVLEIDRSIMTVLLLAKIECELIIDS